MVEIGAIAAVALVLVHHISRNQRGDFCGERVVFVLGFQVFHCGLVLLVLPQNGIDEAKTLEVVVNQHVLFIVLQIKADQFLVDFQTFDKRIIACTEVGLDELLGGQPPFFGVAFGLVGVGLFLIVFRHAVEHKFKQRNLIFNVFHGIFGQFVEQHHEIASFKLFQRLDGFQCFVIMLVDSRLETLLVPIFHLHLGDIAIDGQVLADAPVVFVQIVGVCLGDFLVQQGIVHLVQLPDLLFDVLDEGLLGVFFHGKLHDVLPIEPSFQQLGLVFVLRGLLFDGNKLFLRRFRQILFEVFLYFFPHSLITVFRGFGVVGVVRGIARHGKSQSANGH